MTDILVMMRNPLPIMILLVASSVPALAQGGQYPAGGQIPKPVVNRVYVPPTPAAPTSHTPSTPASTPTVPVSVPTNTSSGYVGPQPIDVTNDRYVVGQNAPVPTPLTIGQAIDGLKLISNTHFPDERVLSGSSDWILVRGEQDSQYTRPNAYTALLNSGTILVSVRRPSQLALVETPLGKVALHSDGDVMVSWRDGLLRIFNISALRSDCKVKFEANTVAEAKLQTVAIRTGYEVVASADHKLGRRDMRPPDGIARRRAQLIANGHVGVSEFSVQSVLQSSPMIAHIQQQHDAKETRILAQMSKMAAVLNVVNSPYGYTVESNTGLASAGSTH